jgi:hypothetical protein
VTARNKTVGPKKLSAEDLTAWGAEIQAREPIMPEGMQFVNSKNLVDLKDLGTFKDKFNRELEIMMDMKIEEHDENVKAEAAELREFTLDHVAATKLGLEGQIDKVITVDIAELDKLCQKRIHNLKVQTDN